jgi:hypothetical protein
MEVFVVVTNEHHVIRVYAKVEAARSFVRKWMRNFPEDGPLYVVKESVRE